MAEHGPCANGPPGAADLRTAAGLLALRALPGVGDQRAIRLAAVFGTAEAFNAASPQERRSAAGIAADQQVRIVPVDDDGSVRLLGYFDAGYPAALRDIEDPPAVLWARGSLPDPARRIAVVGTRAATAWGVRTAEGIAAAAAHTGVSVVSGLALGIDIAAHRAVLRAEGHTTAVLGSGIDRIFPEEHRADAERILEAGGCLLSEQVPGTPASTRSLLARDRLQSGLCPATVLVQCGPASGAMATARFTVEQGRILAIPAVPDGPERREEENAGSLALLAGHPAPRMLSSGRDLADLLDAIS
ncbi:MULTISPECIES: DNA-processing protein DprA [unclassified Nocardioides]|uniref:DNA-processing protein DprA n=1 Tax=unclassified Nocardioides TaxID=2615069 RepID=UPI0018863776|nr:MULTISPECIES: DNA-processing protein DprA [unclassified Nocardioides]